MIKITKEIEERLKKEARISIDVALAIVGLLDEGYEYED